MPTEAKCSICDCAIREAARGRQGDDAVECSGVCSTWVHRKCGGLSKAAYEVVSKSDKPFYCPQCRLDQQELEIHSLRELVGTLGAELEALRRQIAGGNSPPQVASDTSPAQKAIPSAGSGTLDESSDGGATGLLPLHPQTGASTARGAGSRRAGGTDAASRKSNLIVYGIKEVAKGTLRHVRNRNDIENVGDVLSSVDSSVTADRIIDCTRLGKYNEERTRPLLVKLLRTSDAQAILAGRKLLASRPGVFVKPDLPAEQRRVESILLKERWSLINSGISRSRIRISRDTLFVDNRKHGSVVDNKFNQCSLDTRTAPSAPSVSLTSSSVTDSQAQGGGSPHSLSGSLDSSADGVSDSAGVRES